MAAQRGLRYCGEAGFAGDLFHSWRRLQEVHQRLSGGAGRGDSGHGRASWCSTAGEVIGRHGGVHNFTVGQRKGLGVASPDPLYVIQIDNGEPSRDGRIRR